MRFLLINRFWADSHVPTGRMLFDVAKVLAENGHSITVLTSSDNYVNISGKIQTLDKIKVTRIKSFGPRILRWIIFWFSAITWPLFMRWDRCVVLTDPPFMNFFAIWDRWVHGTHRKRYWWVMDLFPEMITASGVIKEKGILNRFFRFLTNQSLGALDGVVVLDEAQRKRLSSYPNWKNNDGYSLLIPPWDFRDISEPVSGKNRFLELTGLAGKKIVLYAGNLGRAHVFEPLIGAAKGLMALGREEWVFVFACRGYRRKELEKAAVNIPNVRVIDYVPPDTTADMLFAASIHVITLGSDWEGICVPSKLYGILPTKRPVIFIGSSESGTAQEILKYKAGVVLPLDVQPEKVIKSLEDIVMMLAIDFYNADKSGPEKFALFVTKS